MELAELKSNLYKIIEKEKDESILEAVYEILQNKEHSANRLSIEEYNVIIEAGRKQVKEGAYKQHNDVKKIFM